MINKSKNKKMLKTSSELTSKEMLSIIREEGYFPRPEDDGDVSFKITGITFTFGTCTKDFVYGRIYYHLKREDMWPAMLAAQHVELSYVAIKALVVPDDESLVFSVESLCGTSVAFRAFFNRALSILADSVGTFADKFYECERMKSARIKNAQKPSGCKKVSLAKESSVNER